MNYTAHAPAARSIRRPTRAAFAARATRRTVDSQRLSQFFYEDRVEPVTPAELAASHSHGEHDALGAGDTTHAVESGSAVGGGSHIVSPDDTGAGSTKH